MKKWLFFIVLILLMAAAIVVGAQFQQQSGYITIAYRNWSLEAPLWLGALGLLVTIWVAYAVLRLLAFTFKLPQNWRDWLQRKQQRKTKELTEQGLRHLIENAWQQAEQRLSKTPSKDPQAWLNYFGAAFAAQRLQAFDRRDAYLQTARQAKPQLAATFELVQARFFVEQQQWAEAERLLIKLQQESPRNPEVLRLLTYTYAARENWQQLELFLPILRKYTVLPEAEQTQLTQQTYIGLLLKAIASEQSQQVTLMWSQIPKNLRQEDTQLVSYYADYLLQHSPQQAEHFLRDALKRRWQPEWVRRYGLSRGENAVKQLALAESWLKEHPSDADLLFCLARLCVNQRLWGKARNYFEATLKTKPTTEVYLEFGALLEQLDERPAALAYYRKGLEDLQTLSALNRHSHLHKQQALSSNPFATERLAYDSLQEESLY